MHGPDPAPATSGIENDYLARVGNRFPADGAPDPANTPPAGYLWNAASQAGLKMRNYGFQVQNLAKPNADGEEIDRVYDPALAASTDMEYRGPDPAYPDTDRAKEFATELSEYDQLGEMPQLLLVRIGANPEAEKIIEDAAKKSRFWNETAIFNTSTVEVVFGGLDRQHIARFGTAALTSPWAKPTETEYDQFSALRTIEIILGLRPMTIFDASAKPMFDAFATAPSQ